MNTECPWIRFIFATLSFCNIFTWLRIVKLASVYASNSAGSHIHYSALVAYCGAHEAYHFCSLFMFLLEHMICYTAYRTETTRSIFVKLSQIFSGIVGRYLPLSWVQLFARRRISAETTYNKLFGIIDDKYWDILSTAGK